MRKLLVLLVVSMFAVSASAYYEDFEDPCNLQGTLVGSGNVSGGSLFGYNECFLADGDYPNASGSFTVNDGGGNGSWDQVAYWFGTDGVTKGYANAPAGLTVWWVTGSNYTGTPWMYVLRNNDDPGSVWQTIYIDQSGDVNPAGYSNTVD